MEKVEYKNIHTGKLVKIKERDTVRSHPSDIAVYVLSDGTRWAVDQFSRHFEEVTRDKVKNP